MAAAWGSQWGLDTVLPATTCVDGGDGRAGGGSEGHGVVAHGRVSVESESGSGSTSAATAAAGAGAAAARVDGDRLAQASARFLADYLLVLNGGGGGEGGPGEGGGDDPTPAPTPTPIPVLFLGLADATPPGHAATGAGVLLPATLIALWDDVAGVHFPAMTAHTSPLVRIAG